MKKLLTIFAAILLLATLLVLPANAAGTGSIAMSSASAKQGDTVTLNVTMPSNPGLVTMTIRVTYDTNVLQLTGVSDPKLLVGAQLNTTYGSPYTISWVDGSATANNTKTGTIATFTFKIKDNATVGDSAVTLQFVDSFDTDYNENNFTATSGKVTVACKTHSFGTTYTNASSTQHTRACSACGHVETTNHTWNSGTVTKTANCKEAGNKQYTCTASGCGATKNESIAKTNDHTFGAWGQTSAPSCTTVGKETRTCSTCQKVETRDVKALGHSMGSWAQSKAPTCTAKGQETRSCSRCSHKETRDVNALGHSMGSWTTTKAATCEAKGEQARSCSRCSTKETKAINALGHKFSNPTVTKAPTCTETGIETGKCTRCSKSTTNTIAATGHSFGEWTDTKAATCTEAGTQERKCSKCTAAENQETPALGHDFDAPVVVKEPTLTEKGIMEGVCKTCGEKTQTEIPCTFKDEATGIEITTEEGVFQAGTEIKVEVIEKEDTVFETVKTALKEVSSKFVAYDVTAVRENATVQPNGTVAVSFKIPEGFGKNVAVYYINDEGASEKLESTVSEDGTSVSATLTHFSSYAVVQLDAEKEEDETPADQNENDSTAKEEPSSPVGIIIAVVVVVLAAGGAAAWYFLIFKKKNS